MKNLIPFIGGKAKKVKANDLDKFTEQIKVDRYWRIGKSYKDVKEALMRGPISMTLNGGSRSFLFYHGGVLDTKNCNPDKLNHAVVGVGYGNDKKSGKDYIIIKNSWGKWWGNGGYAKIAANSEFY